MLRSKVHSNRMTLLFSFAKRLIEERIGGRFNRGGHGGVYIQPISALAQKPRYDYER